MTDKPTPTDADLKAMWQIHAADIGGIFYYARAVLAKWGQPAQAIEPVAREPLPKFLALKFHARRDKKAAVTLLFPGHDAADAWVRGIKGGQHGTE